MATRGAFPAVVFDLFGTLTAWESEAQRATLCDELADILGADRHDLRSLFRTSFTDRATGRTGNTVATIKLLAERLGAHPSAAAVALAVERRLEHERFIVQPTSEALTVLGALREQGCRLGVLSDCSSEIPELWSTLPYAPLVDAAVFSYVVGVRKPDQRMYSTVTDALEVDAADCLYIGDGASNELAGAQACGMTAVMLDNCTDIELQYDAAQHWTGNRMTTLLDVPALLDARATRASDR